MVASADLRLAEARSSRPTKRHADRSPRSDLSACLCCSDALRASANRRSALATSCVQGFRCVTRKGVKAKNGQAHILDMVSIRDRARSRPRIAQFSGPIGKVDLLTGASDTHIVTAYRRTPQPLYDARQASNGRTRPTAVARASLSTSSNLPKPLRRSADVATKARRSLATKRFTVATRRAGLTSSLSSAVHGSVAATRTPTAVLRQYFPRGTDPLALLPGLPQWHCSEAQSTPAKDLGLRNPCQ